MPQNTVIRFGNTIGVNEPEPTPDELRDFGWPAEIVALLDGADATWEAVQITGGDWEHAHAYLEHGAAQAGKDTLLKSLREGKGDPGTPAQDAAKRAEEVAWAQYQIAREDAAAPGKKAQDAARGYVKAHEAALADHELKMLDAAPSGEVSHGLGEFRRHVGELVVADHGVGPCPS